MKLFDRSKVSITRYKDAEDMKKTQKKESLTLLVTTGIVLVMGAVFVAIGLNFVLAMSIPTALVVCMLLQDARFTEERRLMSAKLKA